jgi:hypothetical protein
MHACEMHTHEMHAHEMHAYEVHAHEPRPHQLRCPTLYSIAHNSGPLRYHGLPQLLDQSGKAILPVRCVSPLNFPFLGGPDSGT